MSTTVPAHHDGTPAGARPRRPRNTGPGLGRLLSVLAATLLLSCVLASSAAAVTQPTVTQDPSDPVPRVAPYTAHFTATSDPGATFEYQCDGLDYHNFMPQGTGATFSCVLTQPGPFRNVYVRATGTDGTTAIGGAQLAITSPIDLLAPFLIPGLDAPTITTPITLQVQTTVRAFNSGWTMGSGMNSNNIDRLVGRDGNYFKYAVTIIAPPGIIHLNFNGLNQSDEVVRLDVNKQVSAYTGQPYDHFGLKLGQQTVNDTFLASGRVLFLSIQPATWSLVTKLQRRVGNKWKVIATQRSGGKNLARNARYRINAYGKSLKIRGAPDVFERDCARGGRYRVVLAAKVTTPGGKLLFSRGLRQPVKRSLCERGSKGEPAVGDNGRRP